jgi:hypothetical protein
MSLFIIVKLFLSFFGQKIGSLAGLGNFQYVLVGENGQLTAIPRVEVSSSTANSNSSSRPPPLQQLQQLQQQASTQVRSQLPDRRMSTENGRVSWEDGGLVTVFRIRIHRIYMFLDPDPLEKMYGSGSGSGSFYLIPTVL